MRQTRYGRMCVKIGLFEYKCKWLIGVDYINDWPHTHVCSFPSSSSSSSSSSFLFLLKGMTRCKSEGAGKEARHAVMYGAKEGGEGGGGGGRGGGGKDAEEGAAAGGGGGGDDDDMWAEAIGKEAAILEEYGGVLSPGLGTVNVYIKWFITRWGKEIVRFHKHALHFFTDTTQHFFMFVLSPPLPVIPSYTFRYTMYLLCVSVIRCYPLSVIRFILCRCAEGGDGRAERHSWAPGHDPGRLPHPQPAAARREPGWVGRPRP